ncbi:MAG TPA: hypothetical protein VK662_14195, partial [Acidothermaceae bacterium]|nr:hypothetical protein [Acidothermaceae bacterium]
LLQLYGIGKEGRIVLQVFFDIDDMDTALAELDATHARFDEPHPRARRLENAATGVYERLHAYFAARDWDAITEILNEDYCGEDRRSVVGAGIRHGPDAAIEDYRSAADIEVTDARSDAIATRGARLALTRARYSRSNEEPEAFHVDFLQLVEIDAVQRIAALMAFDLDDFDAAMAELDARYVAGEAAAHAHTWSVITQAYDALNRREMLPTTPDWVNIDHRHGPSFAPGELPVLLASWKLAPDVSSSIEVVHRLNNLGAVVSSVSHETSQEGFEAEWRGISVLTVEGDLIDRLEIFDEADLDTALARFDQLSRPAPRLENAASQAVERYSAHFAARDWDALAKVLADNIITDDHRRVVNAGVRQGRDAEIALLRATADAGLGVYVTFVVIAVRGEHLVLARVSTREPGPEKFFTEVLGVAEVNSHNQVAAIVVFDLDDFDGAIAELDARYLAGEAAAHSRTWSVISGSYAAINRHEHPATTPDWINVDRRRETAMGPGDLIAYIGAGPDRDQNNKAYVEAVHRLTDPGAVVTYAAHETSPEGFDAEWRGIAVFTVEGDMINRTEVFDEADLDTAIARFDQLTRPVPRLENAASQVGERILAHFATRDWDAMAEILADGFSNDDRRRVVGAGVRHGRDAEIASTRVTADLWTTNVTPTVIATRGTKLVLTRLGFSGRDDGPEPFLT